MIKTHKKRKIDEIINVPTTPVIVKRGRGRPRKNQSLVPVNNTNLNGSVDTTRTKKKPRISSTPRKKDIVLEKESIVGIINEETNIQRDEHHQKYFPNFNQSIADKKKPRTIKKKPKANYSTSITKSIKDSNDFQFLNSIEGPNISIVTGRDDKHIYNTQLNQNIVINGTADDFPSDIDFSCSSNARPLITFPVIPTTFSEQTKFLQNITSDYIEIRKPHESNTKKSQSMKKSKKLPISTPISQIIQRKPDIFSLYRSKGLTGIKWSLFDNHNFKLFKQKYSNDINTNFEIDDSSLYPIIQSLLEEDKKDPDGYENKEAMLSEIRGRKYADPELVPMSWIKNFQYQPNPEKSQYDTLCIRENNCVLKTLAESRPETFINDVTPKQGNSNINNNTNNNNTSSKHSHNSNNNNNNNNNNNTNPGSWGFIGKGFFTPNEMASMQVNNIVPTHRVPCYYCYIMGICFKIEERKKTGNQDFMPINKFRVKIGQDEFSPSSVIHPIDSNKIITGISGFFPQYTAAGLCYQRELTDDGEILNRVVDNMDFPKASGARISY
jgi:hypothetical protein